MNLLEEMKWVEWIEPFGPNNEPVYMRIPTNTVIAISKVVMKKKGHEYENDE